MGHDEDTKVLHSMGYAQELSRRMGGFSNFAISFSIICILAGGITSFPLAMGTGGAFQATIGWIVGGVFALVVATSMGQIASAYPTAGGSITGPPSSVAADGDGRRRGSTCWA